MIINASGWDICCWEPSNAQEIVISYILYLSSNYEILHCILHIIERRHWQAEVAVNNMDPKSRTTQPT